MDRFWLQVLIQQQLWFALPWLLCQFLPQYGLMSHLLPPDAWLFSCLSCVCNFDWMLVFFPIAPPQTQTTPPGFLRRLLLFVPIRSTLAVSLHNLQLTLRYVHCGLFDLVFVLVGSICHRVDFYQHFCLDILVGGEVGGTTAPPYSLNVFVKPSQTSPKRWIKLVFDCIVISTEPGRNGGPLIAYMRFLIPSCRWRVKSCYSWPASHSNAIFLIAYYYNGTSRHEGTLGVARFLLGLLRVQRWLVGTTSRGPLRHSISFRMRSFQKDSL